MFGLFSCVVIRWHCYPGDLLRLLRQCQCLLQDPRILCLHLYRWGGCSRSDPLQPRGPVTQRDICVTSTPRCYCPGNTDISRQRTVSFSQPQWKCARKEISLHTDSSDTGCFYFVLVFGFFCFHFHLLVFFFCLALSFVRKQTSWCTGVIAPVNWCELEPEVVPYLSYTVSSWKMLELLWG
jgi:hypothetical protein